MKLLCSFLLTLLTIHCASLMKLGTLIDSLNDIELLKLEDDIKKLNQDALDIEEFHLEDDELFNQNLIEKNIVHDKLSPVNPIKPKTNSTKTKSYSKRIDRVTNPVAKRLILSSTKSLAKKFIPPAKVGEECVEEAPGRSHLSSGRSSISSFRVKPRGSSKHAKQRKDKKSKQINTSMKKLKKLNTLVDNIMKKNAQMLKKHKEFQKLPDKEMKRLIITSQFEAVNKEKIKFMIHLYAVKDFFENFLLGFRSIKGKSKEVIKNGKLFQVQEDINGFFMCSSSKLYSGVPTAYMEELKFAVKQVTRQDFQNGLILLLRQLRNMVIGIGERCRGLDVILELINTYVIKMKVENTKELYNTEKTVKDIYHHLEKHSFGSAGYTLGQLFGETKRFPATWA